MIEINKEPGQRILELGGGANRHPASDVNVDVRKIPGMHPCGKPFVDFAADFDKPLPVRSNEWDGVLSIFCLEHVTWRKLPDFVKEMNRVLKPGGKVIVVAPNIEAQFKWAQQNQGGWDGKDFFQSASEIIFGSLDYPDNTHKSWLSPATAFDLFTKAGFEDVNVVPFGARSTDLAIQATKPKPKERLKPEEKKEVKEDKVPAEVKFDHRYFNGGEFVGGYANEGYQDFPIHEATIEAVMRRKPESVLELGCARGYLGKRFEDRGVSYTGLEVSRHCWLTRVCDSVINHDVCETPWGPFGGVQDKTFDLCLSVAFLEHVPEDKLPTVIAEMERTCKRGLHGIDFGAKDDGFDQTHCLLKPRSWWVDRMPTGHEVVNKQELENELDVPFDRILSDPEKRVKLNIGCGKNLYHNGWNNIDTDPSVAEHARLYKYGFSMLDARNGFPYPTGTVELIHLANFLECLTYKEARELLRELRRVIKPDGLMRVAARDCGKLSGDFILSQWPVLESKESGAFHRDLSYYDELSAAVKEAKTAAEKLWALTKGDGQQSCWDEESLLGVLDETGWVGKVQPFRVCGSKQMLAETLDNDPCLNLFADATPKLEGKS